MIKIFWPQPSAQVVVGDRYEWIGFRCGRLTQPQQEADNEGFEPWDEALSDVVLALGKIQFY